MSDNIYQLNDLVVGFHYARTLRWWYSTNMWASTQNTALILALCKIIIKGEWIAKIFLVSWNVWIDIATVNDEVEIMKKNAPINITTNGCIDNKPKPYEAGTGNIN